MKVTNLRDYWCFNGLTGVAPQEGSRKTLVLGQFSPQRLESFSKLKLREQGLSNGGTYIPKFAFLGDLLPA